MVTIPLPLPASYNWLYDYVKLGHPVMVVDALRFYGLHEAPGSQDNPVILAWAKECGVDYFHDVTPWCGLFMAEIAKQAEKDTSMFAAPNQMLWALNWAKFGEPSPLPSFGDVLVFQRTGGGHVGLYIGESVDSYHVLGGNEGDAVNIVQISKMRLKSARRPHYNVMPTNVKPIKLASDGHVSVNEE